MLKHNLLIIYRGFLKHKSTFIINLLGLSIGMTCAILIYLWIGSELNVNQFHEKESRLYQVMANNHYTEGIQTQKALPDFFARTVKEEIYGIESAIQMIPDFWFDDINFSYEDKQFKAEGSFAEEDFFEMFSYELIEGDPTTVLSTPDGIVISESLAKRVFNTTQNLIGKTVNWTAMSYKGTQQITGIMKDMPDNSSMHLEFISPFKKWDIFSEAVGRGQHWNNNGPHAYLLLDKNADVAQVNESLEKYLQTKTEHNTMTLWLQPYADTYLYNNYENGKVAGGRIKYLYLFGLIGVFILLMACINFINLTTARATRKAKEIGVKKAIGAERSTLIFQYLTEAVMIAGLASILAIIFTSNILPAFNELTESNIQFAFSTDLLLSLSITTLLTGLIAGIYPALYLSGFNPAIVFRGMINRSVGEIFVRKGLVVFQFALSVVLIISMFAIGKQIDFIQNKNLGYNKDHIVYFLKDGKIGEDFKTYQTELLKQPGIIEVVEMNQDLRSDGSSTSGVNWEGKNPEDQINFSHMAAGPGIIKLLGLNLLDGRGFSKEFGLEDKNIIINEKAAKTFGFDNPVGKTVKIWGDDHKIIGMVEDFHTNTFHTEIMPCFLWIKPNFAHLAMVKLDGTNLNNSINTLNNFNKKHTGLNITLNFIDQKLEESYKSELQIATLSRYFSGLAIFISCLGLFGLATFSAERRIKEIGIRKTLGASQTAIVLLLSKDFTKMVLLGILFAIPIAWYATQQWLNGFAYHTELPIWLFVIAGISALIIAWVTISFQAIRAANLNPVEALRNE